MMWGRAFFICAGASALGAAIAGGCGKRMLDPGGPGMIAADAGGAGTGGTGTAAGGTGTAAGGTGGAAPDGGFDRGALLLIPSGAPCLSDDECVSRACVDGVCCQSLCSSKCARCNAPGFEGVCVALPDGQAPKEPDACPVEPLSTCGRDGQCDGAGGCRLWALYTRCADGRCDGDAVVGEMVCDGRGHCRNGPTIICAPYLCDPATASCLTTCAVDADCPGSFCETTGRCHVSGGAACTRNADCASGFCSGGVCCNTACADPCMACTLAGRVGTCSPLPDGCPGADAGSD